MTEPQKTALIGGPGDGLSASLARKLSAAGFRVALGVVRRGDRASATAAPSRHSPLDATESLMRVTSGKSRVRKAARPDL